MRRARLGAASRCTWCARLSGRTAPPATAHAGGARRRNGRGSLRVRGHQHRVRRRFSGDNVTTATKEAAYLQETVFADWRVELLHGRIRPPKERGHGAFPRKRNAGARGHHRHGWAWTCPTPPSWSWPTPTASAWRSSTSCAAAWGAAKSPRRCFYFPRRNPRRRWRALRLWSAPTTASSWRNTTCRCAARAISWEIAKVGQSALKLVNVVRDEPHHRGGPPTRQPSWRPTPRSDLDHQALALEVRRTFSRRRRRRRGPLERLP